MYSTQITRLAAAVGTLAVIMALTGCGSESEAELIASAKTYLSKKDSKAAVLQLKAVLEKNPQSAEARYLLGKALLQAREAPAALLELNKAMELQYEQDLVVPELAHAMLLAGQDKKLTELYSETKLQAPTAVADLKTSLATALFGRGQREQAAAAVEAALGAAADFAPALILKARIKASQRDFDAALSIAEGVLAKDPNDYLAWHVKGDVALFSKLDKAAALVAYRKAVELEPRFMAGHEIILAILMQDKDIPGFKTHLVALRKVFPGQPQTNFFNAQLALLEHDFRKGRELTQQLLRRAPNDVRVLQLAASVEYQDHALGQAEAYLNKALQVNPGSSFARRLLAEIYLQSGQSDKALSSIAPLLSSDGVDAETLYLGAQAELAGGNAARAEQYFLRAAKLNPGDARISTSAALSRLTNNNSEEIFREIEAIAAADKGTVADLALISGKMRKKDFDGALRAIDALEVKSPKLPLVHQLRGRVQLFKQNAVAARKAFEQALAMAPEYLPAASSLAALDLADNKPEAAQRRFDAILKTDPQNLEALLALIQIKARSNADPKDVEGQLREAIKAVPNDAAPRLLLVGNLLTQRQFKEAVAAAQEAVGVFPDNPKVLEALAQAQLNSGDAQQAINTYRKLAAADPKSPILALRLAAAYLVAKNRPAAIQSYRRALDIRSDLQVAQASLIALAIEDKRFDEALQIARTVQRQRAKQAAGWVYEGDIAVAQKKFDAAAAVYRAAFAREKDSDIAIKLFAALKLAGYSAEATKFVAEMDKATPRDEFFQMHVGDEALARNDFAAAETRYRAVIAGQPRHALALNNLAYVLVKQGKPGAVALAEQANEIMPAKPSLMDTLALALAAERQFDRAIAMHTKAVELEPADGNFRLNLARTYIAAGDKVRARKELETLEVLGNRFPAQPEVARQLQALR